MMFVCSDCGYETGKWSGKCDNCGSWNTLKEVKKISSSIKSKKKKASHLIESELKNVKSIKLEEIEVIEQKRLSTSFKELDCVLGGGLVQGMVALIGGEPGIGKSTLMLQLAQKITIENRKVLYVSGEESLTQIRLRSKRLKINSSDLYIYCNYDLEEIISQFEEINPDMVIIDSIQSISYTQLDSSPGSINQLKECTALLTQYSKRKGIICFLVGHVTKEGMVAGPKIIEHMVDTVLYFEGDKSNQIKILRTTKNRFGSTNEIGLFEMVSDGLSEILNPSSIFLLHDNNAVGSARSAVLEGTRAFLVEVQALITPANYGTPQRVAIGFDQKRLAILLAIIEKNLGIQLRQFDVFINIAGGIKVSEPSLDLAVIASLISSYREIPLVASSVFCAEVGLNGEIRPISQLQKRLKEANKLGIDKAIISDKESCKIKKITLHKGKYISDLVDCFF